MAENMTREQKIEHLKKEISITESLVNDLTAFRNEVATHTNAHTTSQIAKRSIDQINQTN